MSYSTNLENYIRMMERRLERKGIKNKKIIMVSDDGKVAFCEDKFSGDREDIALFE